MFEMALAIWRDLFEQRAAKTETNGAALTRELTQTGKEIERFLDRIATADSDALITTYEARIKSLEEKRRQTEAKIAIAGQPRQSFEESFRTAFAFLANPWKLWASERLEDRVTTLRMVFSEPLAYCRKEGLRTAKTTFPFKALADFSGPKSRMVGGTGFEPVTPAM